MNIILPMLFHKPLWFVVHYITINNIDTSELFDAWEKCKLIPKESKEDGKKRK